jgi:sugar lactone lactonase YvrE
VKRYSSKAVTSERAGHAEGPLWDPRYSSLMWVDQFAGLVHRGSPGRDGTLRVRRTYEIGFAVGAIVPAPGHDGWWLAGGPGFATLDPDGTVTVVAEVETPAKRMNDGELSPDGVFYAGSMAWDKTPGAGALYRFDGITATTVLTDVTISNGIAWDDDRVYYVDTTTQRVDVFDADFTHRRTAFEIPATMGAPDGMCLDSAGCLWISLWGGGQVRRFSPSGETLAIVDVDAPQVSSCAFVGDKLYITTSQEDYSPADSARHPGAGLLFAADVSQ